MRREAFLDRVRSSVGSNTLPASLSDDPGGLVRDLPAVDLVESFVASAAAVDAVVHRDDPGTVVDRLVAAHGTGPLLAWDSRELPGGGLIDRFTAGGCPLVSHATPIDSQKRLEHHRSYEEVRFGLTGAEAGFAETGSIVLRSGPGRPRMASLIPLVHVALLPADRIHRSHMHWLVNGDPDIADAANVIYITGPSRTADIEQQINLGVHGPRELHIVLV